FRGLFRPKIDIADQPALVLFDESNGKLALLLSLFFGDFLGYGEGILIVGMDADEGQLFGVQLSEFLHFPFAAIRFSRFAEGGRFLGSSGQGGIEKRLRRLAGVRNLRRVVIALSRRPRRSMECQQHENHGQHDTTSSEKSWNPIRLAAPNL